MRKPPTTLKLTVVDPRSVRDVPEGRSGAPLDNRLRPLAMLSATYDMTKH